MLTRPGPESTRSQLTGSKRRRRYFKRSVWISSAGEKPAWPPSVANGLCVRPSQYSAASPSPVPAAMSAWLPAAPGAPS